MKNILSHSIATILVATVLASSACSQQLSVNTKNEKKAFSEYEKKDPSGDIRYINDVNGKVLASFHRTFGEKPDAKWFKSDEGFVAFFKDNNKNTYVYFSNNGAIQYTNRSYSEHQLPKDVRHTVKSNFYDYSIINVLEVHKGDFVCFFVKVQDKASIKTVRVIGEEWEVVEELKRIGK